MVQSGRRRRSPLAVVYLCHDPVMAKFRDPQGNILQLAQPLMTT